MKLRLTSLLSVLLILVFAINFVACSGEKYTDTASTSDIAGKIFEAVNINGGYRKADSDYLEFNISGSTALCSDYCVYFASADTNMNEFGVMKANSTGDAKKLSELCGKYLDQKHANWNPDYLPGEAPKINDAEVKTFGVYVVYLVMTDSDASAAFTAVKNLIAE